MKEALDAIETYGPEYMHGLSKKHYTKTLRQAIAEAEKQEPVHAIDISQERVDETAKREHEFECPRCGHCCKEWVGLTDEEAAECWSTSALQTWKNIEAKLKEKNT
jgi:hypothetical protein